MGSSLFLQGGTVLAKTVSDSLTQTAHGFAVGDVIRYDTAQGKFIKAQANNASNAEVTGVVSAVSSSSAFTVVYSGYIDIPTFSGLSYPALFLSDSVAGGLTASPPSAIGSVVKPIAVRSSSTTGHIVVNYLGTQIGGSSTVAIDQIQPVGTIMPYAGTVIPDTWLECSGASYGISDYPELYDRLLYSDGSRAPLYGHVATLGFASAFGSVGQILTQGTGTALVRGRIIAVSGTTVTVQTLPVYSSTSRSFVYNNAMFAGGTVTVEGTSTTSTITTTSITHFNAPDLRGRFAIGVNGTAVTDNTNESDSTFVSSIGLYPVASMGGEEKNSLSPISVATSGSANNSLASVTNNLLNNIPPYVATRYIIKAKPYTRAAIIDELEINYPNLLVTDLRSGLMRGAGVGEDVVFKTNTSLSTTGTERMRLTNTPSGAAPGGLILGDTTHTPYNSNYRLLEVAQTSGNGGGVFVARSSNVILESGVDTGTLNSGIIGTRTSHPLVFRTNTDERMRIDGSGNVGIGANSPSSVLHIKTAAPIIRLEDSDDAGAYSQINCNSAGGQAGSLILEADKGANNANSYMRFDLRASERVRITPTAVGIGTSSPTAALDVQGANGNGPGLFVNLNGSDDSTVATSLSSMWTRSTVHFKMTGTSTTRLLFGGISGGFAGIQSSNASGGGALNMAIQPYGGNVGISVDPDSTYKLKVQGKIYASDDIVAFSDARQKRDISPITDALHKVRSLVGVLYTDTADQRKTGLLAQDVQAVLPEAVTTDEHGNLALAYGNLAGILVQAIKELATRVDELEKR